MSVFEENPRSKTISFFIKNRAKKRITSGVVHQENADTTVMEAIKNYPRSLPLKPFFFRMVHPDYTKPRHTKLEQKLHQSTQNHAQNPQLQQTSSNHTEEHQTNHKLQGSTPTTTNRVQVYVTCLLKWCATTCQQA